MPPSSLFTAVKRFKKMPPSLINFDKKGPENQVINFAWPYQITSHKRKKKVTPKKFCKDMLQDNFTGTNKIKKAFWGASDCLFL